MAKMTYRGWTTTYPLAKMQRQVQQQPQPQQQAQPRPRSDVPRLARALGVERRALGHALNRAHYDLTALRKLTLTDLSAPPFRTGDTERIFYLVQWERLQAYLETHAELPEPAELTPLLDTLTPIFERHFSRTARLNETLLSLYRAELGADTSSNLMAQNPEGFAECSPAGLWQRFVFRLSRRGRSSLSLRSGRC